MARAPVADAAKTRLASKIGVATATRFARHSMAVLIARVGSDRRRQTSLWVTPDASRYSRHRPNRLVCVRAPQRHGDLGRHVQRALRHAPPGPVVRHGHPAIRPATSPRRSTCWALRHCVFGLPVRATAVRQRALVE
jgi:hypothetical protein